MNISAVIDRLIILRGKYGGSLELVDIRETSGKFVLSNDVSFEVVEAENERGHPEKFLLFVTGGPPLSSGEGPRLKLVR